MITIAINWLPKMKKVKEFFINSIKKLEEKGIEFFGDQKIKDAGQTLIALFKI